MTTRNTLEAGVPILVETVDPLDVAVSLNRASTSLAALGAVGVWNLQGRRTPDGGFRFFELNARPTGITGLRAHLGFNELDLLFDAFILGRRSATMPAPPAGIVVDARPWTCPPVAVAAQPRSRP
jgi:hypothetical protein